MRKLICIGCLVLFQTGYAQYDWNWAEQMNSGSDEFCKTVCVDPVARDVYVGGLIKDVVDELGIGTYGGYDGFVAKYDSTGGLKWAFNIGSSIDDEINSLFVDSTLNLYVTGGFSGICEFKGTGGASVQLTSTGDKDVFVAKYDTAGVLQWVEAAGNNQADIGNTVVADNSGVYVAGEFKNDCDFGGGLIQLSSTGGVDFFVAKYDLAGGILWAVQNSMGVDDEVILDMDVWDGEVFAVGYGKSNVIKVDDGTIPQITLNNSGGGLGDPDVLVIKLDGSNGIADWAVNPGGGQSDIGYGIAANAQGVYVGGSVSGSSTFVPLASVSASSGNDGFISMLDPVTGDALWVHLLGYNQSTPDDDDVVSSVTLDGDGNIFFSGYYNDSIGFPGNVVPDVVLGPTTVDKYDLFVASFRPDESFWQLGMAGGPGKDKALSLTVLDSNNIYLVGTYDQAPLVFATTPVTTLSHELGEDGFLAKIGQAPNLPPIARPDSICAISGQEITISIGSNDIDPNNDILGFSILTMPLNGFATLSSPDLVYTSTTGFVGVDSVLYEVCDGGGLCDTATVYITVSPTADAGPDQFLEFEFETNLQAVGVGTWVPITGSPIIQNVNDPLTWVGGLSTGVNLFAWEIQNVNCPSSVDTVAVVVEGVYIPNAISPNMDGFNDFFVIKGILNFETRSLHVFNKRGMLVYEAPAYQNDWAGTNNNGTELLADTYYYVLSLGGDLNYSGFIEVKR